MYQGSLPPRSNKASWSDSIQIFDDTTGDAVDISAATAISVRARDRETCATVLEATLANGAISLPAQTGVISFSFTETQMGSLCAKSYDFGLLLTISGSTSQIILGTLPVIEGL